MSSLVKSNRNKKLQRGPDIQPKQIFKMDNEPSEIKEPKKSDKKEEPKTTIYEPQPTTLKIDTKIRDQINALSLIGIADTQREVLESLINLCIEDMTIDERRKFEVQYQVLEDKTIKTMKKK